MASHSLDTVSRTISSQSSALHLHHPHGCLHLIFGPMFSGKTTELLRRMKRYSLAQHRCLLIKYRKDTRYSLDGVVTHDRQESKATACSQLSEAYEQACEHEVIGIDEGQFFPDLVEFCEQMANMGKIVIVAALDGTFQRQAFGNVLELVPMAETAIKLNAVCMRCFSDAAFSKRITTEQEVEVIGGSDKYIAVCRKCYFADEAAETADIDQATPTTRISKTKTASTHICDEADEATKRQLFTVGVEEDSKAL